MEFILRLKLSLLREQAPRPALVAHFGPMSVHLVPGERTLANVSRLCDYVPGVPFLGSSNSISVIYGDATSQMKVTETRIWIRLINFGQRALNNS